MKLEEFKDKLFARGKESGFSEMELYRNGSHSFELRVFKQEIDHYSINEDIGVSFRGKYNGKIGYSYTEKLDQESISLLLNEARQNAEILSKQEGEIYRGEDKYRELSVFSDNLAEISPEEKIALIKELENKAYNRDQRVKAVDYCLYSDHEIEESIFNNRGIDLNFKNNFAYMLISVIVEEGDEVRSSFKFLSDKVFKGLDSQELANRSVDEAVSLLGARSLPSGEYPVILRHDVAANLLSTFSSAFSAENVQKNLSLFKGKLGAKIASDQVTITDNPFLADGFRTSPFDAEGVATREKDIVKDGKLLTFLHNLKTARKDGVQSTGNAYRSSHKSSIDVAPTNMYIRPGQTPYQEMVDSLSEGLIIIDIQGLHAGANPISGEFSLSALGYYVKDGEIVHPVEQITIAGNFMELLEAIQIVGDDFKMGVPGSSHFGSPSLLVKKLAIAGE